MHKKLLCAVAVSGLIQGCSTVGGNGPAKQEYTDYINDANAARVMTSSGDCLRTVSWSTDAVVVECQASAKPQEAEQVMAEPANQMALSYDSTALFDFDSAELSAVGVRELDGLIAKVGSNAKIGSINVVGHADSIGSAEYNQGLSEQRAVTVQRYLQRALSTVDVMTTGMGETAPVSSNSTEAGRRLNRRVEVTISADADDGIFN